MWARLRWKESVWVTRGQRKRILAPTQADLRLWYMRTHTYTHTFSSLLWMLPLLSSTLFLFLTSSVWWMSVDVTLLSSSVSSSCKVRLVLLDWFHLVRWQYPLPFPCVWLWLLAFCMSPAHSHTCTWTHTNDGTSLCSRLCRFVALSSSSPVCLTGSYWLAYTLVIPSGLSPSCPISPCPYENSFQTPPPHPPGLLHKPTLPFFHYHTSSNTYISPFLHQSQHHPHIPLCLSFHSLSFYSVHKSELWAFTPWSVTGMEVHA